MIKVKELRVGNCVWHDGRVIIIDGVDNADDCIMVADKHIPIPSGEISGIDITPEWLGRLGFEAVAGFFDINTPFGCMRYSDGTAILFLGYDYQLRVAMDYEAVSLPGLYEFVHQLQNIFYCITMGEELTIKEITA